MFTMVDVSSRLDNRTVNREKVHITPTKTKRGLWTKDKGFYLACNMDITPVDITP